MIDIGWSPWRLLEDFWYDRALSTPGLYRIRRAGHDGLDYIGQTGMPLRRRLQMLRGVYGELMPYDDPHTAAPALWAQFRISGERYEVSVAPIDGTTPWRKGMEAVAISLYRQDTRRSPTFNFGRMPAGYKKSSGNTTRLVQLGKRFRGGPTEVADASHVPGVPPMGPLGGEPTSPEWCGHTWSEWQPLIAGLAKSAGLYRLRTEGAAVLVYIGQGLIGARLVTHARTAGSAKPQGLLFAAAAPLQCSWVLGDWLPHQRLELENDLIAAHVIATGNVPPAQFVG